LRWRTSTLTKGAVASAAVLAVALSAFDLLGADCGDSFDPVRDEELFRCNTSGYVLIAVQLTSAGVLIMMLLALLGRRRSS